MREYRSTPSKIKAKSSNPLIEEFKESEEYRYAYAEEHLNTTIALQIKALREQRGMKQADLAAKIGTKQPGIARLENINYSRWNTETLKRVARALGVRLKITFETFGTLLDEDATFSREALERNIFEEDPAFKDGPVEVQGPEPDPSGIFDLLEAAEQKSNVVSYEEFLGKRDQSQKGNDLYEGLVGSTSQSRRTLAS
jgi:transcriptional regulator with XRE-family HTH domain